MTVAQLKRQLALLPDEAGIFFIWDGEPRSSVDVCFLAKSGDVMLADDESYTYSIEATPADTPYSGEEIEFELPKKDAEVLTRNWIY